MTELVGSPAVRFERNTVGHMREAVLFEGPDRGNKITRFWILLVLASIIASAGVVADSTATVIGAMIVAPMMLPIQGTMLSLVLGDRVSLVRSVLLMVTGALAAIGIGFLVGLVAVSPVVAQTNSQVAGRVSPGLIDLLSALATGVVGSVALVRKDISDTLPGVAIAISLVPPLCVSGLTLESGAFDESIGAALLFLTNVAAIMLTGAVVMAVTGAARLTDISADPSIRPVRRRTAVVMVVIAVIVVGVPLTLNTVHLNEQRSTQSVVSATATRWAAPNQWQVVGVTPRSGRLVVAVEGPEPAPSVETLRTDLIQAGVDPTNVTVVLVPSTTVDLGQQGR